MWQFRQQWHWLGLVGLLLAGVIWAGDPLPPYTTPLVRVAKLAKPPTIDGTINAAEWADASALTGMVTYGGAGGQGLVAPVQDVVWYLGYDDQYFYLALHSPHPPGTWPAARVKDMDNSEILWDDHTEIQIATQGRKNYAKPGKGFYKIMHNAKGVWRDEWLFNGTPGTEHLWDIGGACKSSVTADHWDMEMSISLAALRAQPGDGQSWVMQLLRADAPGGVYFAGWAGEAWMSWDKFGAVTLDPAAPVFRLLSAGDTAKGHVSPQAEVVGTGAGPQAVRLQVLATAGSQVLCERTTSVTVAPGERRALTCDEQVAWPVTGGRLRLRAVVPAANGKAADDKVLYDTEWPIVNLTDTTSWQARVVPWLEHKPKTGSFASRFAYWAYYGVAEAAVDLDFFGLPPAVQQATAFRVDLLPKGDPKPVASATGPIARLAGQLVLPTGELKDGDYQARIQLLDAAGQPVDQPQTTDFQRKHYPFEHNTLGTADTLLPPWTPLVVDQTKGVTIRPWNREITLAPDGLPARIRAGGGAGPEDLLTSPIHWEAVVGGQTLGTSDGKVTVDAASASQVQLTATAALGPATLAVKSRLEFDGWYECNVTLSGAPPATTFERLSLIIPLWSGADTMWAQRASDSPFGANRLDAIPAGQGVVWDSSQLLPCRSTWDHKDWHTFVPILHAGSYDKGVWWFSDENDDWTDNPALPTVQYVRTAAGVELRIHLLAAPATLATPRQFHFAFQVEPVKKYEGERKEAWGWQGQYAMGRYAHCSFGWREWGRSTDGYYLEAEDRQALHDVLLGLRPVGKNMGNNDLPRAGANGDRIVLYGSTSNMSDDLPEFNTFSGEWCDRSYLQSDKLAPQSAGLNIGGSYERKLEREQHEIGCNWAQSQVDCFVWYHEKLLRETPVNGTWWDNSSTFVIKDYDPQRQSFRYRWNTFMRRQLSKRLNTLGWAGGRTPWWVSNVHVDGSFNQVGWHIENDFYINGPTNTLLDQLTVDQFRAYAGLRRGLIHRLTSLYQGGEPTTTDEARRRARNLIGLCLLHDIGAVRWSDEYKREYDTFPALADEYVGFFSEESACSFTGYWRSQALLTIGAPKVYASVYRGKGRALIVLINGDRQPVDVPFTLSPALLGRAPARVYDAETRQPLLPLWDTSKLPHVQRFGEYRPGVFNLEGHGFRMLVVE